ncbi:uncharacterized protein GGS22DRAFT_186873 [Annulohypoxylon maeteangense]|uniref:uncharacterized protein n=1 Tax=Annulohypoxylon maeteangense TaxID=1927788 RepID=UPI002008C5BF|nr:uncharacterized protein GGS22DRAFT_186873 [Annulohypoxylon maeteangense]KAI0886800.1 hypothetical protein GGS22DRAFT_186873 [Annulohypoxylon maeteangense]
MIKLSVLALAAVLPSTLGSSLNVINNCGFEIYCGAAKNNGDSSPAVKVGGGGSTWKSPLLANDDNIGSVLKCSDNPDLSKPFQMELALQNGHSWFDLSALDGDPFVDVARHAEIAGQCVLDCPSGSVGCEWPVQPDCQTSEDAWLTLC